MKLSSAIMSMKTYAQHSFPPIITQISLVCSLFTMSYYLSYQLVRLLCEIYQLQSKTSRATIDYLPAKGWVMGKKGAHNVKKQAEKVTFQLSCFPLLGFYTSPLHLLLPKQALPKDCRLHYFSYFCRVKRLRQNNK